MQQSRTMICIVCPKGCRISVTISPQNDGTYTISDITGFSCLRGKAYVEQEIFEPKRTLTTTVRTLVSTQKRLAVRSDRDIPLEKLRAVIAELRKICLKPPIAAGTCVLENPLGIEAKIITSDELL